MDKKKILIIAGIVVIVILAAILLFVFMGGNDETTGSNTSGGSTQTITGGTTSSGSNVVIEYWGLWEAESVMQPLIQKYQSQNPNVTIKYTQKPGTQYESNLFTRITQGSTTGAPAPDIFRIHNSWLSKYQPHLSPLPTTVMSASDYSQTFYPTSVNDFTGTDNNIYAIPLEIDGLALFYNKQLLEGTGTIEVPADWDTLTELARELTITDESGTITQAGMAIGSANNISHSAELFSFLLLQNNVEVISADNKVVTLSTPRAQSALEFYLEFSDPDSDRYVWSPDLRLDLELFYSGNLAFLFAPSWRAFDIIDSAPGIEFGMAPLPQLPGNDPVYYSTYWGEAVSSTSKYPEEAWKFVKFLSEQEQMKELYSNQATTRAFGEPYSRKDLAPELADQPYVGAIIEMAPQMQSWKMGEQAAVEEALDTAITSAIGGSTETSSVLKTAEETINQKLSESIL